MNVIGRIDDSDIGQRSIKFNNANPKYGAYGIIKKDDKIALLNISNRGYYVLPGASVIEKENYRSSFLDTVYNQIGCKIDIEKVIGEVVEERCLTGFKQNSYVYVASVIDYSDKTDFTEDELFFGTKIEWVNEDRALSMVALAYENLNIDDAEDLYKIKFEVKRSQTILEEYLKSI